MPKGRIAQATVRACRRDLPRARLEKREPVPDAGRRAPQGLDPHGRPAPVHNSAEDDQLEIPAFLRRQAN